MFDNWHAPKKKSKVRIQNEVATKFKIIISSTRQTTEVGAAVTEAFEVFKFRAYLFLENLRVLASFDFV